MSLVLALLAILAPGALIALGVLLWQRRGPRALGDIADENGRLLADLLKLQNERQALAIQRRSIRNQRRALR